VWGSGPNDVFAVGYMGRIVHFDGARWSSMSSGTPDWLKSVWGTGPDDVYAISSAPVGGNPVLVLHWDGTSWSRIYGGDDASAPASAYNPASIWGSAADDILTVGGNSGIRRGTGTS